MEHDILKQRLIKEKGKVVDVLLTECDWDYVKKLYDKDFGRMLKEIERIESEKEQAVEQARTEKEQAVEQARTEKEQAIARNQQLLYTLLETYKETGLAKEQAVDLLTQKIPDISLELAEETAEQIFKN